MYLRNSACTQYQAHVDTRAGASVENGDETSNDSEVVENGDLQ